MTGIAFLIAIVAAALAVVFWFQNQSASGAVAGLKTAADEARKEAELARAEQRKVEGELKARTAQLQETREKLNEVRKKTQEGKPKIQQPRGAREAELEEDLAHARKLTEEAHASETAARRDLSAARASEAQIKSELSAVQERLRALSQQPAAAAVVTPVPESALQQQLADELAQQRKQLEAARSELERQVQQAERNSREAKRRETELRDEVRKMRGRAETNNRVYLVTKGELEVTKERLAQAERKLWQAGIPLAPLPSKERPKAKGPAAADRPREEGAAQAAGEGGADVSADPSAGSGSAHPEGAHANGAPEGLHAAAGEPIAAGESVTAPEAAVPPSMTPGSGTAPIRRRPSEGLADKPR